MDNLQLANSGGKDSLVIYTLVKDTGANIPVIHANTTIDPPGTLKYIRETMPETEIMHPAESFYQLVTRKMFPTRTNRYCCEALKEHYGIGKNTIEGVRSAESSGRKGRDYISCDSRPSMKGAQHIYPIYDWTDDDVYEFIRMRKLELAPCYHKGLKRLGCVGCPQVTRKGAREMEFRLYPKYYESCKKAIKKGMENNPHWKISRYTGGDAEKTMRWWLSGDTMRNFFGYDLPFIRKTK
jgi:phosphoadenosine phosphosulfate reductase